MENNYLNLMSEPKIIFKLIAERMNAIQKLQL